MVAVQEHLPDIGDVVVLHNGLDVVDGACGDAGGQDHVHGLLDGVLGGPLLHDDLQLRLMGQAVGGSLSYLPRLITCRRVAS